MRAGALRYTRFRADQPVLSLAQLPTGEIWAAVAQERNQLAVHRRGQWQRVGSDWGLPDGQPWTLLGARDGTLWVSLRNSIFFLRKGARRFKRAALLSSGSALSEDRFGNIWVSNADGTWAVKDGSGRILSPPRFRYPTLPTQRKKLTLFDRDGSMWGLGGRGIFRIGSPLARGELSSSSAAARVAIADSRSPLSGSRTNSIFEDHEGSIWFSTATEVFRLRNANVAAELRLKNSAKWGNPLLGASDGTVYIGEADGVYRVTPGGKPLLLLAAPEPQAVCEGTDGTIWSVLQHSVVGFKGGKKVVLPDFGKTTMGISDCAVDNAGRLWLAGMLDGALRWSNDKWERLLIPTGEDKLSPATLLRTREQGLIVGFSNGGLGTITAQGKMRLLIAGDEPIGKIRTVADAGHALLLGGPNGLMQLKGGKLHILPATKYPLLRSVAGIVQTPSGITWLRTSAGIVRVSTVDLSMAFGNPKLSPSFKLLDFRDGLPGPASSDAVRGAVRGGDGRVWFGSTGGMSWVDPGRQSFNRLPPPVSVIALKAGKSIYEDPQQVNLAAGASSIAISFAALSLAIPERVKVRYQLNGEDTGWIDPGLRRQAFYTNLRPGDYVFRVIAANHDGVWNRKGATLRFTIAPTFLQSNWFIAFCAIGAAFTLWWAYKFRLGQLMSRMQARLEERERIARDLHDTLLQGFQGLVLRFQSIADQIPRTSGARHLLDQALDSADEVLEEGRNSVAQLRRETSPDIAQALMDTAKRMRIDYPIEFKMTVEGSPKELHPVVRAELRRIGDEAIINAFQHSRAKTIEIVITYHSSALLIGIRDDGIGIEPSIVGGQGRQGHFGLVGMHERAREIRADIKLTSRSSSGTEIHIRVPGRIAYNARRRAGLGIFIRQRLSIQGRDL